jgi:hypothetical protein
MGAQQPNNGHNNATDIRFEECQEFSIKMLLFIISLGWWENFVFIFHIRS